jgi:hypothetical protein
VLGTRTGRPSDAPIQLCLCKTPASTIPCSDSIGRDGSRLFVASAGRRFKCNRQDPDTGIRMGREIRHEPTKPRRLSIRMTARAAEIAAWCCARGLTPAWLSGLTERSGGTRHVATQYRAGNSVKLKLAHAMFVREAYSK